jgi:DUF4097 and DUF4098 domain-containing protein YvlB
MRRTLLLAVLLFTPSLALAQENDAEWLQNCESERSNRRPTACDVRVQRISARDLLRVRPGQNGAVQIVAEDRNDMEVHARIQASADSRSEAAEVMRRVTVDYGATISTKGPDMDRDASWAASYVIFVPRNTNLDLVTQNGPISVKNVVGKMELSAQNGPIQLSGVGGDVKASAQNGPLQVRLTGTRWNGAGLDAETQNGPVQLIIPESYNARLETGTVNGPIETDFPVNITLEGRRSWKRFSTTLGSGGPLVRVVTTNGPLSLRRP